MPEKRLAGRAAMGDVTWGLSDFGLGMLTSIIGMPNLVIDHVLNLLWLFS